MADAKRVLTQRQLNRALLGRQLLLDRARYSLPKALERVGGIQAQYAPSMYIGLWSRVEGFRRETLTRALERRTAVQATMMRATIHLVSAADYWPFVLGTRQARREWWLRTHDDAPSPREMAATARKLRRAFAGGTLARAELDEVLSDRPGRLAVWRNGIGLWLELVRVPPSGTWERRRADLYAAAEDWLGRPDVAPKDGMVHLVRSYLRGFGPASRKDIASFAGVPLRAIAPALEQLDLRRFEDTDGGELLDLPRAPLPDPDTPAPVRFLPVWDSTLLVHARRTGVLPEEHRPKVFNTRTPHSVNTFLVDGAVAGTWRYEKGGVRIEPFGRLDPAVRRELDAEAERLAEFHA